MCMGEWEEGNGHIHLHFKQRQTTSCGEGWRTVTLLDSEHRAIQYRST